MRSGKLVTKTQASMHTFISVTNFWLIWQRRSPAFQYRCTKKFLISRATPPKGTKERGQGAHGGAAAAGSGQCGRPGRAGILATECRPYTGTQTPLRCRPGPRADLSRGASCRFRDGQRAHVNNQPCIVELCDGANVRDDFVKSIAHRMVTQCSARGDRPSGRAARGSVYPRKVACRSVAWHVISLRLKAIDARILFVEAAMNAPRCNGRDDCKRESLHSRWQIFRKL